MLPLSTPHVPPGSEPRRPTSAWHWHSAHAGRPAVHVYGARLHQQGASSRRTQRCAQTQLAHALLEQLLEDHFASDARARWRLAHRPDGRPYLGGPQAPAISLSHSGPWVACAAGQVARLGVDIEHFRPQGRDWAIAAPLALHPAETRWVLAASAREREARALRCWTCKEALTKAADTAATAWTDMTHMAFGPDSRPLVLPGHCGSPADWSVQTHPIEDDALLSVAWQT